MPRFQIHKDIKQLPLTVDAFLEADPAINNIPLGVLTRIRDMPEAFSNYQIFVISEQETILAYAHHIPPYPLILSNCSQDSLSLLATTLREQGQPLPALHGQRSLVERFLECWPELSHREQRREVQGLYRLDQVIEPPRTGARFDQASLDDLPQLAAWHKAFWQDTGDFTLPDQALWDMLRSRIEGKELFLLRDDKGPVSMASLTRKVKDGRVLSYIYTPPEFRGRGYAAELTAALSRFCLENGSRFCCLFTQMENPTSNKIYQQVGYRWVDNFLMVRFEE